MRSACLTCTKCSRQYELSLLYKCPVCGGIVEFDIPLQAPELSTLHKIGVWRFGSFLPKVKNSITLGEGGTPLIPSVSLAKDYGLEELSFKMESSNPTGSFKDRGIAVAVSMAKSLNAKGIVVASTGNAAASATAYAARAGLPCVVCVPASTEPGKIAQAIGYGARLALVEGSFSASYDIALQAALQLGLANVTTTFINPYNLEGNKTVAYELYEQGPLPDAILIPTGAGPLLVGLHKGFKELLHLGKIRKIPRLIGVQAEVCSPIVHAYEKGGGRVVEWRSPFTTLAKGVGDPLIGYADDGTWTLRSILETGGCSIGISEREIADAVFGLAEREGIFAEPTASIGVAAIEKLLRKGLIEPWEKVVAIITGHGLKHFERKDVAPVKVGSIEELVALLEQ